MSTRDSYSHRTPTCLRLAGVIALAIAFGGPGLAGVDETLGGLPGKDNGGNIVRGGPDERAAFFVQGTYTEVTTAVAEMRLEEQYEDVEIEPGILRRTFHGKVDLVLDEYVFTTTGVRMGVITSPVGGVGKYVITWEGGRTPIVTVSEGATIQLPYGRIRAIGMLDEPAILTTWNRVGGRSRIEMERHLGQMRVSIRH